MKLWLNVADAAEHAGVCRDTIYTAVERGELRHVRHRRSTLDSREAGVDRRVARAPHSSATCR
jgi:excisionase family DNA binding protein